MLLRKPNTRRNYRWARDVLMRTSMKPIVIMTGFDSWTCSCIDGIRKIMAFKQQLNSRCWSGQVTPAQRYRRYIHEALNATTYIAGNGPRALARDEPDRSGRFLRCLHRDSRSWLLRCKMSRSPIPTMYQLQGQH